jgi:hypothetical protein
LFQGHNRFFELFAFHLQLGEHFVNVHSPSPESLAARHLSFGKADKSADSVANSMTQFLISSCLSGYARRVPQGDCMFGKPLWSPFAGGWHCSTFISYETPAATEGHPT